MKKFSQQEIGLMGMELAQHPLVQRLMNKSGGHWAGKEGEVRGVSVLTAADVLGERLATCSTLLMLMAYRPEALKMNMTEEVKLEFVPHLCALATKATPYLWVTEIRRVLGSSVDSLPSHTLSPTTLPEKTMWWTFDNTIHVSPEESDNDVKVNSLFIMDGTDELNVMTIGEIAGEEALKFDAPVIPFVEIVRYPYGKTYPHDFTEYEQGVLATVLAGIAFLNSPHIPKETHRLTRPERREVTRKKAEGIAGEEIKFVTLRRPSGGPSNGETDVEWKHRWLVNGHYRDQWYPAQRTHHLIWIAPYVKGPEDAPMIEKVYKVSR